MKKLLFVWLFFIGCLTVDAESFYSPYSSYSEYSDKKIEASDTVEVKTERRYQWYKDNKVLGDYHHVGSVVPGYPNMDENDFYETEFSEWLFHNPGFKYHRVTETRQIYEYKDVLKAKYLHFHDLTGGNLSIGEIEIFHQNQKIDYEVLGDSDFNNRLHDGKYDDFTNTEIPNPISIDLKGEYHPDEIVIKIYLYDTTENQKNVHFKFTNTEAFTSPELAVGNLVHAFNCTYTSTYETFTYSNYLLRNKYGNKSYSEEEPEKIKGRVIKKVTQYRVKDTLFRYYRVNRVYYEDYSSTNPGDYIKDEEKYKDFYSYRTRDKVVIDDNLVFDNYDKTLNDLILETTTNDIKIISDFNINKNGTYQVKFVLPFETLVKTVTVDIIDNEINELNNLLLTTEKNLKDKQQTLEENKQKLTNLKDELENLKSSEADQALIEEYEKKIMVMEQEVTNLLNKINELEKNKTNYNNKLENLLEQKNKQTNYSFIDNLKYWLSLIIVILIIIITYYMIRMKKMSYQN